MGGLLNKTELPLYSINNTYLYRGCQVFGDEEL